MLQLVAVSRSIVPGLDLQVEAPAVGKTPIATSRSVSASLAWRAYAAPSVTKHSRITLAPRSRPSGTPETMPRAQLDHRTLRLDQKPELAGQEPGSVMIRPD